MRAPKRPQDRQWLTRIMLYLTLVVFIIILVVSSALYANFERIALSLVYSAAKDSLVQAAYSIEFMQESARNVALQVYYDPEIRKLLFYPTLSSAEVSKAIMQLDNYRSPISSFIHSIYVFNRSAGVYYLTSPSSVEEVQHVESFFDSEVTRILETGSEYAKLSVLPREVSMPVNNNKLQVSASVYTCLFYETEGGPVTNAVIINISAEWMREIMDSLNTDPSNDTFIIDSTGATVTDTNDEGLLTDLSDESHIRRVLQSRDTSGYFVDSVDGGKSLVTHVSADSPDWRLVRVIPYNELIGDIDRMRVTTILIAGGILLLGISASYVVSRRLYGPVKTLLRKKSLLEKEQAQNIQVVKAQFLRALLNGRDGSGIAGVRERFGELSIALDPQSPYVVVLFVIDDYLGLPKEREPADRDTVLSAAMERAGAACGKHFANEVVEVERDRFVLVVECGRDSLEADVADLIESIQSELRTDHGVSFSATISGLAEDVSGLSRSYEETLEYSNYRLFEGIGCTIHVRHMHLMNAEDYSYPVSKEKELIEALMLGKAPAAKTLLTEIIQSTQGYPYTVFNLTVHRLFSAIHSATSTIVKRNATSSIVSLGAFMDGLKHCLTVEEIERQFHALFDTITAFVEQARSDRHVTLYKQVLEIVAREYTDPNLSLSSIADAVSMSPGYLGRLVKQMRNESVAEIINNQRLDRARELLTSTRQSVHEVAAAVGIRNEPYFYTLFKKRFGVTPNEYRRSIDCDDRELHSSEG